MTSCSAYKCTSRFTKKEGITFHSFPKEEKRRDLWIRAVNRENWQPSNASKLCSKHFREEDFDRTSLCCVRLREHAVPSIFSFLPRVQKVEVMDCENTTLPQTWTTASKHLQGRTEQYRESLSAISNEESNSLTDDILSEMESSPETILSDELNTMLNSWTKPEDKKLKNLVDIYGNKEWEKIALFLPSQTAYTCRHRWETVVNTEIKKKIAWTKEEDRKIIELVKINRPKKWTIVATYLPGRSAKQCRERWYNQLDPNIKKSAWTAVEEKIICHFHEKWGTRWSKIAKLLPGRTDNAVKNYWYGTLSRIPELCKKNSCDSSQTLGSPDNKITNTIFTLESDEKSNPYSSRSLDSSEPDEILNACSNSQSLNSPDDRISKPIFPDYDFFPVSLGVRSGSTSPKCDDPPESATLGCQPSLLAINLDKNPIIHCASPKSAREMWEDLPASQTNMESIPLPMFPEYTEFQCAAPTVEAHFKVKVKEEYDSDSTTSVNYEATSPEYSSVPSINNSSSFFPKEKQEPPVSLSPSSQSSRLAFNPAESSDVCCASPQTVKQMWEDLPASPANMKIVPRSEFLDHFTKFRCTSPSLALKSHAASNEDSRSSTDSLSSKVQNFTESESVNKTPLTKNQLKRWLEED